MKFQLISDIHLEFYKELPPMKEILTPQAPNLILAGDICFIKHPLFLPFFQKLSPLFKRIIYVLGNHEYYTDKDITMESVAEMEVTAQNKLSSFDNIHILQKSFLNLGKVIIYGCTLWSYLSRKDFECGMRILANTSFVRHKRTKLLHPNITNQLHLVQKNWLESSLNTVWAIPKKVIVVTHYLPSLKVTNKKYTSFNKAYYSNCDELVMKADVWCCGHIHEQKITHVGETPVYLNAIGRPFEKKPGPCNMLFFV